MTPSEKRCEDMADVCELAHKRTVRECKKKKIPVDCTSKYQDGECIEHYASEAHYSTGAQSVFDRHYEHICEVTGI